MNCTCAKWHVNYEGVAGKPGLSSVTNLQDMAPLVFCPWCGSALVPPMSKHKLEIVSLRNDCNNVLRRLETGELQPSSAAKGIAISAARFIETVKDPIPTAYEVVTGSIVPSAHSIMEVPVRLVGLSGAAALFAEVVREAGGTAINHGTSVSLPEGLPPSK